MSGTGAGITSGPGPRFTSQARLRGLTLLVLLALVVFLVALLVGSSDISVPRAFAALAGGGDEATRTVLLDVRLPRVLAGFGVGSLLALSGVLLQALFRNPLADPYVLGVSGGAAVGALLAMIAGGAVLVVQSAAVAGALGAVVLVYLLARGGGAPRLLLTGVVRARTVGLAVEAWRTVLFIACAALTALAVVSAGTVGFVGLITPHAVRLSFGSSDHRIVAPAAAIAGGMLLAAADLIARTVASPRQLPVGAIMALVGAPLFVILLRGRGRPG